MGDLTSLTAISTPLVTDIAYTTNDPAGARNPRKVTWGNIANVFRTIVETLTGKTVSVDLNSVIQGTPATGNFLRDNGTKFVGAVIGAGDLPTGIDATKIAGGGVTSTEFDYIAGVTSDVQTQINTKGSGDALVSNPLSQFASTTSLQLKTLISGETGSGALVFGTSPTISAPSISYTINAQTGTTYTTVLLDAGKVVTTSNASAITVTIPPNSSVAYPIGSSITVISIGVGLTSFAIGTGVTINSTGAVPAAPVLRAQYSSATALKTATNTWVVFGDIE